MALGEFEVASLEETSALSPHKQENIMILKITKKYFWERMI
jgi:hypothetical protein